MATEPSLPAPRDPQASYRIAIVCLGNICRSPMADVILNQLLEQAGIEHVEVVSAGTGDWHVGKAMDQRAAATLEARGFDPSRHRAQQIAASWLDEFDLVLAMDASNYADITSLGDSSRVRMFRELDPDATPGELDVPDPYYGDASGFDDVVAIIERSAVEIVKALPTTRLDTQEPGD